MNRRVHAPVSAGLTRSARVVLCLALSGCGTVVAHGGSGAVGAGVDAAGVSQALAVAVADLGRIGLIDGAEVQTAPPDEVDRPAGAGGAWISLHSSAVGYLDEERARWIAGVIISQVWRVCHDGGADSVVGGQLAAMPADDTADGSGMSVVITSDLQGIMFTSQDGVTASTLTVGDKDEYRSSVAAAAHAAGLTLDDVVFTQSLGTVVQISESTEDPVGFIRRYGRTNPGLTLDPSEVEGVLLVVRDPAGEVVMTSAWATGSQSGEGGPGPAFGHLSAPDA